MSINSNIRAEMKTAMINKDTVRLTVLRGLIASFMNEMIAKGVKADEIDDNNAIAVIKRSVKQRKDSIEQFTKGGRNDLVQNEQAELKILEQFLPASMSKDEIKKVAIRVREKMNIVDKSKSGQLTGAIMKELAGKADGADVKSVVDEIFA